ncbi:hypothetical protein B5F64_03510 [Thomasclavelia spiroformis]|nr:hypothetical protein B5F64_03510 [Thomasclavelia spiroformis]
MKKKGRFYMKYKFFYFLSLSIIIFSCSLYYKQYLPNYLNHSIVILLVIMFFYLFIFLNKHKRKLTKIISLVLSICLFFFSFAIFSHNDKLSTDGKYIGIDISKWNKEVNLQLASQEIDYVIIRCGYTSLSDGKKTKEDPYFKQNLKQCEELSIPYGIYYYSLARDENQAKKEANFVTKLLNNKIPPLGVFLDLEDEKFQGDLTNKELTTVATTFLENIPNQNKKGIYANHHWWSTKLTDPQLDKYIKWKARYNDKPTLEEEYAILQYSQTGSIKGIIGNVDLNIVVNKYW